MPDMTDTGADAISPPPTSESDIALQRALAAAVAAFGRRVREHGQIPPFPADAGVKPADVAFAAAAMLRAAEITSFEIGALFNF